MNNTIKFELSFEQANIVLESLSRMPYQAVAALIAELQKQAAPQVSNGNVSMPMPEPQSPQPN
jgi:hypothetical protein